MNSDLCVYISENHYFSRWPDVWALLHTGIGSTATHLPRLVFVPSHLILEMAQLFIVGYQESANHQNPVDLLLHGFGANAMRQYGRHISRCSHRVSMSMFRTFFSSVSRAHLGLKEPDLSRLNALWG